LNNINKINLKYMKCPKCDKYLDEVLINHSKVDRCGRCGGIWFDKDELKNVKDERDHNLSWLDFDLWSNENHLKPSGTFINCPRDGKPLFKIKYGPSDVMVDVCLECRGVWLDKNELDKILKELKEKINTETLPEYLKDLEEEIKDLVLEPGHSKEELRNIAIIMKLIEYRLASQHPKITEITSVLPD